MSRVNPPGERVDRAPLLSGIDFGPFRMRIPAERYRSREYQDRERERLWMRVWQVAGRQEDIPDPGDWMEYRILDQSYVIVRGGDGEIRGFVNACRHRGNALCQGRGHATRLVCPYHRWSYRLDGRLLAVSKPDYDGPVEEFVGREKQELGLIRVPVDCFAGFVFLNPDPGAAPLSGFLGEAVELLAPYRVDEMVPHGLNVREAVACNWKVVLDAFQEGYHIQGVHPELVGAMDESLERYRFCGDHSVATAPFGTAKRRDSAEELVAAIRRLPETFPAVADALPGFDALLERHRGGDGVLALPSGVTPRLLLQQALRESWDAKGLDVDELTASQLSDNHFWMLFPNFFMTIHAGEATVILATPDPGGDPNRCFWHVMNLQWFPPHERKERRAELVEVAEGDHFSYFLALEQDFEQMARQQRGLQNHALEELTLSRQELRLAHFHAALDRWVQSDRRRGR